MDVCIIRGAMRLSKEQEQEQRAKSKSKLSERGECLEKLWKLTMGKLSGHSDKPCFYILNRSMLTIDLAMTVSEDTSR